MISLKQHDAIEYMQAVVAVEPVMSSTSQNVFVLDGGGALVIRNQNGPRMGKLLYEFWDEDELQETLKQNGQFGAGA